MFGFMKNAHDYGGYIHALDSIVPFIVISCVMPTYMRTMFFISGAMIPWVSKALKALKHIEKASDTCIIEREKSKRAVKGKDMLQSFFDVMEGHGDFGKTEVKMEVYGAL
jgi:hypothetical protein